MGYVPSVTSFCHLVLSPRFVTWFLSPGFTTWFYGVDGELYATFDSFALDPNQTPPTIAHVFVSPAVYRINPATGNATFVAQTDLMLTAFVDVDEEVYAFKGILDGFDHTYNFPVAHNEVVRLDLRTGKTGNPTEVDSSVGLIFGAAPIWRHR